MKAGFVALVAAAGMTAAPALAADAKARTLSIAPAARVAAPARKGEALDGSNKRWLIAAAVTAAIVAGIFVAADQIGDDDPNSN